MCTLSWRCDDEGGLEVFFSRDEQRDRVAAVEPEVVLVNRVRCLFPLDPLGGGTWIGVNEYGVIACLLNDYGVTFETEWGNLRSRGLLVRDVLGGGVFSRERVGELVEAACFAPFKLLVFAGGEVFFWRWDGATLSKEEAICLVTSSSWESERVEACRASVFSEVVTASGGSLEEFHKHQLAGDAESSVCMSRELTQTVSLTRVKLSGGVAEMGYAIRVEGGLFGMEERSDLALNGGANE